MTSEELVVAVQWGRVSEANGAIYDLTHGETRVPLQDLCERVFAVTDRINIGIHVAMRRWEQS